MKGKVDPQGRALLPITLRNAPESESSKIDVWVDTGFTGDLVLPHDIIKSLNLTPSAVIQTMMADGRQAALESYVAWLDWFGETEEVEVCASTGRNVLLGVRLMIGKRLIVDYQSMDLHLE